MLTKLTHANATFSRRRWLAASAGLVLGLATFTNAKAADDTIKVGVLHSLSGTMAISETTLKDTVLFMIDEQNKKGGVLGKKLEAVVVDPASNWPLFAEKARELITKDKVAVVFGCWTSVSRKSVLPVFKELNSILFYPVQYEGEESERNVFYTGAAPNQQAIPAVDYLMKDEKGKRWVLAGTDDACGLHHERRRHRALLQGTWQRGHQGDRYSGCRVLGRRRRTRRHRHQAAARPSRRLELLRVDQDARQREVHQGMAGLHQEFEAYDQRPDGSHLYRLQNVGEGRAEGEWDR